MRSLRIGTLAGLFLCGALPGVAQGAPGAEAPQYTVKPSDVVLPQGVPLGQYRRSFRPFENWTLVCDENLAAGTMVCNVSQSLVDKSGRTVFSWSLAAAEGGQPYMILRTLPDADLKAEIDLKLGSAAHVKVPFTGCNPTVCLGNLSVSPQLMQDIKQGVVITAIYWSRAGEMRVLQLPLKGLQQAVSAIRG